MSSSASEISRATAISVKVTEATLQVELNDGRSISVPVSWYPRLENAEPGELANFMLSGPGTGIHWPDLDEDISIEALIIGKPSNESQESLAKWLKSRSA